MNAFRETSHTFHKSLSKDLRKSQGIFFTPASARHLLFDRLQSFLNQSPPASLLEPSFGSGEFLLDLVERFPNATIYGVESNQDLFRATQSLPELQTDTIHLFHGDFLKTPLPIVDVIIGNPPYFVTTTKEPRCMTGRGNIFVQFLYKCITEHLKDDGILAFVLPTSFYNCSYYEPCRAHIYDHFSVLWVETIHVSYHDANQDTMLILLQNRRPTQWKYFYRRADTRSPVILSPNAPQLTALTEDSTTLEAMGFEVKTGSVVWNQHKTKLCDTPGTLLIYSGNIANEKLCLTSPPHSQKKQYIQGFPREPIQSPAILVTRGYGNHFAFQFAYVEGISFYGENHVNIILPKTDAAKALFPVVLTSFRNPKTTAFLKYYVGNGALSKTELATVLPIFTT